MMRTCLIGGLQACLIVRLLDRSSKQDYRPLLSIIKPTTIFSTDFFLLQKRTDQVGLLKAFYDLTGF
jgi:hypothetical protein